MAVEPEPEPEPEPAPEPESEPEPEPEPVPKPRLYTPPPPQPLEPVTTYEEPATYEPVEEEPAARRHTAYAPAAPVAPAAPDDLEEPAPSRGLFGNPLVLGLAAVVIVLLGAMGWLLTRETDDGGMREGEGELVVQSRPEGAQVKIDGASERQHAADRAS